jgi:uncharacterized protein
MAVNLRRPILIGGATLCFVLLLLDALGNLLEPLSVLMACVGLVGTGFWWFRRSPSLPPPALLPGKTPLTPAIIQQAIADAQQVISQITTEAAEPDFVKLDLAPPDLSPLHTEARQIAQDVTRQTLHIAIIGAQGTGKTTLEHQLQAQWTAVSAPITCAELPSSRIVPDGSAQSPAIAADLALFLITGDITASEQQALQALSAHTRTVLVFNKQDQYLPPQRAEILSHIQHAIQTTPIPGVDLVGIAAAPAPIKVRQHQADGNLREWLEPQAADITPLLQRLQVIIQQEAPQLVLAGSLNRALLLKAQAKTTLNTLRRARALAIMEQFQWMAAATAFASPLPTVDVIATTAINAQMILDLGTLYRQKLTLPQAQKIAKTLGSILLKLGLVELSSHTISTLLKTNALTFIAGGCVQGISAAYLTRISGLSLIEYFSAQDPNLALAEASPLAIERITQILQAVFQNNHQLGLLQTFMGQVMQRVTSPVSPLPPVPAPLAPPFNVEASTPEIVLEAIPTPHAIPTLHSNVAHKVGQ